MTESSCVEYKFKLNDSFERGFASFLNSDGGRILARLKGLGVVVRDGARKDGSWVVDYDVYRQATGGLNETEITVLHLLVENPRASYAFVSEKTGLSRYRVEKIMKKLKVDGFVVHVGSVQHGHWEVSEEAKESIK